MAVLLRLSRVALSWQRASFVPWMTAVRVSALSTSVDVEAAPGAPVATAGSGASSSSSSSGTSSDSASGSDSDGEVDLETALAALDAKAAPQKQPYSLEDMLLLTREVEPARYISPQDDVLLQQPLFDTEAVQFLSHQTFMEKPFDSPIDRKVALFVRVDALRLEPNALPYFQQLVEKRYNPNTRQLKLVTTRFPTVLENKRELLEKLYSIVQESNALAKEFGKDGWKPLVARRRR